MVKSNYFVLVGSTGGNLAGSGESAWLERNLHDEVETLMKSNWSLLLDRQIGIIRAFQQSPRATLCDKYVPQWWVEFNDELSWLFIKRFRAFILFADNSQILHKISVIPIVLTFIYLVALHLLLNNQINSSLQHIIFTLNFTNAISHGPFRLLYHQIWFG